MCAFLLRDHLLQLFPEFMNHCVYLSFHSFFLFIPGTCHDSAFNQATVLPFTSLQIYYSPNDLSFHTAQSELGRPYKAGKRTIYACTIPYVEATYFVK